LKEVEVVERVEKLGFPSLEGLGVSKIESEEI